jgi:hypothetical protein
LNPRYIIGLSPAVRKLTLTSGQEPFGHTGLAARLVLIQTTKEDSMANKEQKSNSNNKKEAKLSLKEKRLKKAEKKKA